MLPFFKGLFNKPRKPPEIKSSAQDEPVKEVIEVDLIWHTPAPIQQIPIQPAKKKPLKPVTDKTLLLNDGKSRELDCLNEKDEKVFIGLIILDRSWKGSSSPLLTAINEKFCLQSDQIEHPAFVIDTTPDGNEDKDNEQTEILKRKLNDILKSKLSSCSDKFAEVYLFEINVNNEQRFKKLIADIQSNKVSSNQLAEFASTATEYFLNDWEGWVVQGIDNWVQQEKHKSEWINSSEETVKVEITVSQKRKPPTCRIL